MIIRAILAYTHAHTPKKKKSWKDFSLLGVLKFQQSDVIIQ